MNWRIGFHYFGYDIIGRFVSLGKNDQYIKIPLLVTPVTVQNKIANLEEYFGSKKITFCNFFSPKNAFYRFPFDPISLYLTLPKPDGKIQKISTSQNIVRKIILRKNCSWKINSAVALSYPSAPEDAFRAI